MPDRATIAPHHHHLFAQQFVVGLDIGRVRDHSACVLLRKARDDSGSVWCAVLWAHQWRLGIDYPSLVEDVAGIMAQLPRMPEEPVLICDSTGVGEAITDLLRQVGLRPIAATITAGSDWSRNGPSIRVPKALLASELQVLFQTGRIAFAADLPHRSQIEKELVEFRVSINTRTGHESFEASAEKVHDDMVMSLALAAFASARYLGVAPKRFFFGVNAI